MFHSKIKESEELEMEKELLGNEEGKDNKKDKIDIDDIDKKDNIAEQSNKVVVEEEIQESVQNIDDFGVFPEIEDDLYIQIFIESFMITYENCDDFGIKFMPYLDITILDQVQSFYLSDFEKNLDNSVLSDNNSELKDDKEKKKNENFFLNDNKTKIYRIHEAKTFILKKGECYSSILFTLKNSNFNKLLYENDVTIGECRVPISYLFYNKYATQRYVEGSLGLSLNKHTDIGSINAAFLFSERDVVVNRLNKNYLANINNILDLTKIVSFI